MNFMSFIIIIFFLGIGSLHRVVTFNTREKLIFQCQIHCSSPFNPSSIRTMPAHTSGVTNWHDYFNQNKERLIQQYANYKTKEKSSVDSELCRKVAIWNGNITQLDIDAIVNAANSSLLGGGGVDGAIHRAAGPQLKEECRSLNGCQVGEAKITKGYKLPAKNVIHTVGPQGEKPEKLASCYNSSLKLLVDKKLRTIAFPCISTGVYGYPQEPAAHVALKTVRNFLEKKMDNVDQVIFCLFLPEDVKIYENLLQLYFPVE